jgi:two-component system response regulator AtoC
MRSFEQALSAVARAHVQVLLVGEAGVGKRLMAQRLHQRSPYWELRLQRVRCAEAEPHAFSNGCANYDGGMQSADVGMVLLEEITELSLPAQASLLQAMQDNRGVRYVATSRKNLEQEVRAGRMREDLVTRMAALSLRVPPLRHRKEDIEALITFFLEKYAAQFQRPVQALSAATRSALQEYNWPGNVKELESAISALVATGNEAMALATVRWNPNRRGHRAEAISLKQVSRDASRSAEREVILKALTRTRGNRKRAAVELQISYKALLYKLKQIGVQDRGASN